MAEYSMHHDDEPGEPQLAQLPLGANSHACVPPGGFGGPALPPLGIGRVIDVPHSMQDRKDALDMAKQYLAPYFEAPLKPNGYVVDGWKPVPVSEQVSLIIDVADWLLGDAPKPEIKGRTS